MYYPYHLYNEQSVNYYKFCKYSLIKYKPFVNSIATLFDNEIDPAPELCIQKWNEFISNFS